MVVFYCYSLDELYIHSGSNLEPIYSILNVQLRVETYPARFRRTVGVFIFRGC
jgi:hypothetical protein